MSLRLVKPIQLTCDEYLEQLRRDGALIDPIKDRSSPERLFEFMRKCAWADAVILSDAAIWPYEFLLMGSETGV